MTALLLFLFLPTANPSQSGDVRAALERRYEELARATERRDLPAFLAIRHETFHSVLPDGQVRGPIEMTEYSKQFFAGLIPPVTARFTIRSLSVSADGMVAAADVFQELSRSREFDGKPRKFETTVVQRETWIKTTDGWKLKLVDNIRDQTRRIVEEIERDN